MARKKYTPEELMQIAIEESYKSVPEHTNKTDPLVGAVITTRDGEILAKAHRGELRVGEHCEYTLIERKLKDKNLCDCALYVTMEPCVDEARNGPKRGCSTHILKARISKVYIGMRDPDPNVENDGANLLISNGISIVDFPSHLETEIREGNAKYIEEKQEDRMHLKKKRVKLEVGYLQESVTTASISHFDDGAIKVFLKESKADFNYPSDEFNQWALDFELIQKDKNSDLLPTRLGLLLFGKKVEDIFPQTVFKVELDYGNGEPEIKDFNGPLVKQLPSILDFIKDKGLRLTINRTKGKRETHEDFPFEILREAIANAIIHRDYEIEGATNYIYIDPNKIIVRSPGILAKPLTLKDLRTFDTPSVSRNPKIMFVFNKMGLAEQRGIGLRNMKQLNQKGFPLPVFNLRAGLLEITFGRTKDFIAELSGVDSSTLSNEDKNGLIFIQEKGEISVRDYANQFKLEIKTANRRLRALIDKGLVLQFGEKRGTKYKLK